MSELRLHKKRRFAEADERYLTSLLRGYSPHCPGSRPQSKHVGIHFTDNSLITPLLTPLHSNEQGGALKMGRKSCGQYSGLWLKESRPPLLYIPLQLSEATVLLHNVLRKDPSGDDSGSYLQHRVGGAFRRRRQANFSAVPWSGASRAHSLQPMSALYASWLLQCCTNVPVW